MKSALKAAHRTLKEGYEGYTETEKLVRLATAKNDEFPDHSLMLQLAAKASDGMTYPEFFLMLWRRFTDLKCTPH
eukprot:g29968.t1